MHIWRFFEALQKAKFTAMNKTLLITRPNYDLGTNFLYFWSLAVIEKAKEQGFKILDLSGKKANKKSFSSYIKKHKPFLVFINGHGSSDTVTGHNNEPLIEVNKNDSVLKNKVIYARSCDSAQKLGFESIKKGCLAFLGYKKKFFLVHSKKSVSRPFQDKLAGLFLLPSNLLVISILKGNTAENSFERSQKAMSQNLSFMLSTKASVLERDAALYLYSNKINQVLLGDPKVKIT